MTLLSETAIHILYEALNSEIGITVDVLSPDSKMVAPTLRAKQVLYRFKSENADFAHIQINLSPNDPDRELWLIRTDQLRGTTVPKPDKDPEPGLDLDQPLHINI